MTNQQSLTHKEIEAKIRSWTGIPAEDLNQLVDDLEALVKRRENFAQDNAVKICRDSHSSQINHIGKAWKDKFKRYEAKVRDIISSSHNYKEALRRLDSLKHPEEGGK